MLQTIPRTSRLIVLTTICILLLNGCSKLIIRSDDNAGVIATKVTIRAVNCALTMLFLCSSEWDDMVHAKNDSLVWYGKGNVKADDYQCQREASYVSSSAPGYMLMPVGTNVMFLPVSGGGGMRLNNGLYNSCMTAKGYGLYDEYELNKWLQSRSQ